MLPPFIKIFQNTPQLCWGDEWPPLSPGACLRVAASAKAGERVRGGNDLIITPTLILPHPRHNSAGSSTRGRKVL